MSFELTILGSSSALPTSERYPTAQVLNVLGQFFLIDCGEGTQIQMRRLKLRFSKISRIFISHLHGDHYFGLPGLISTFSLLGLKKDVHIYAPEGLRELIRPQIEHMKHGLEFSIHFHLLDMKVRQVIYSDEKAEVVSFPVKHSIPTCGFLFREKQKQPNIKKEAIKRYNIPIKNILAIKNGADFTKEDGTVIPNKKLVIPPRKPRSYAFCTDTKYYEPIIEQVQGVDLLYHEATFGDDKEKLARKTLHSTARHAATIALNASVKKLLIGHFSARYKNIELLVNEAREVFTETYAAHDGDIIKVK